jgi:hypothetical protein
MCQEQRRHSPVAEVEIAADDRGDARWPALDCLDLEVDAFVLEEALGLAEIGRRNVGDREDPDRDRLGAVGVFRPGISAGAG